jgi:phosphate transport system protein
MVFQFFKGGESTIDVVEATLAQMVLDGRDVYETAMDALFGGGKSKETKRELKSTDRGINTAQQDVRRDLMIHASVSDTVDLPLVLAYMSTVKDAERIGDYSKNFYDLVKYGADFENAPDRALLNDYRQRVSTLLSDAAETFKDRDEDRARALIAKADVFLDDYDAQVKVQYESTGTAADAVSRALYFRFLKRITAHVMNFLTSLVLPIDRLDYYDETKDDRA